MGAAQLLSSCSWLWLPKWGRGSNEARVHPPHNESFSTPTRWDRGTWQNQNSFGLGSPNGLIMSSNLCPYFSEKMGD